ncbi:hypothetical protein [Rhodococcus pyridinivorans]|uniref:hypothetical protein n=1 Tax=Rhodococcus pyridinivorans TaxID=103816 RepID=UPI00110EDE7A|nr:hypothetical protein [Rhodococcus pyridinivorans]
MKPKKILASAFLSTALVLAPAGVASATPTVDTAPGIVNVSGGHDDHGKYDHHDHDKNYNHHDKKYDRDHHRNHYWRPDCYWWGPWLVCNRW